MGRYVVLPRYGECYERAETHLLVSSSPGQIEGFLAARGPSRISETEAEALRRIAKAAERAMQGDAEASIEATLLQAALFIMCDAGIYYEDAYRLLRALDPSLIPALELYGPWVEEFEALRKQLKKQLFNHLIPVLTTPHRLKLRSLARALLDNYESLSETGFRETKRQVLELVDAAQREIREILGVPAREWARLVDLARQTLRIQLSSETLGQVANMFLRGQPQ